MLRKRVEERFGLRGSGRLMGMLVMVVKVEGEECLHHLWLSNSPSSALSGADVTQPNCSALEQHIIFTLIVEKLRWRLFRDAAGLDVGSCTRTLA